MAKKKKKSAGARKTLVTLCVVLGIILAVLVAGTIYAEFLLGKVNYIDSDAVAPTLSQEEIDALYRPDETEVPEETEADVEGNGEEDPGEVEPEETEPEFTLPTIQVNSDNVKTFLLVGSDDGGYRGKQGASRTDSMILCTFNKDTKQITLLSLARDLYVKIPGYKDNRINASYALGGVSLLKKTIEKNYGIPIDGSAIIDFGNFENLINYVGGIEVELTTKEAQYINEGVGSDLKAGQNTLNGLQALLYSRFRKSGAGEIDRTGRQRFVLSQMVNKYKNLSKAELLGVLDDVLPMITTDLSKEEILSYFLSFFPMLAEAEIVSTRIPVDNGYYLAMRDGMSVIVARQKQTKEVIESIYGK